MRTSIIAIGLVLGTAACGSSMPSQELVNARRAYEEARTGAAADVVPGSVHEAKKALERAEAIHADDPQSEKEKSYAYVAQRRAELSQVHAVIAQAEQDQRQASAQYLQMQEQLRQSAESQLEATRDRVQTLGSELRDQRAETQQERQARMAAEQRAERAIESLKQVAQVKEEARGTVITLSGQVLFLTGKAELLPTAQDQLTQVAKALVDQGPAQMIIVEGHTDSMGSESSNQQLSLERAKAVRDHLVSHGVPADRIQAVGKGENEPLATNDTPTGRAQNRRVEIVVGEKGTMGAQGGQDQPQSGSTTAPGQRSNQPPSTGAPRGSQGSPGQSGSTAPPQGGSTSP